MDALVNVDSVFSGHHLVDGRTALLLLATLLCGSHLNAGDREGGSKQAVGKPEPELRCPRQAVLPRPGPQSLRAARNKSHRVCQSRAGSGWRRISEPRTHNHTHSAGPKLERKCAKDCGKESRVAVQLPGHGEAGGKGVAREVGG